MKELAVLAEIESTRELVSLPTAHQAGVWRYRFFMEGPVLPFMGDIGNRESIRVNNIIINNEEYAKFDDLDKMLKNLDYGKGGWVNGINGDNVVYVSCPGRRPPDTFHLLQYGTIEGFTNGSPLLMNGTIYRPGLMSLPRIAQSADAFKYNKMKFNTATITLDNSNGRFDSNKYLFGNEFNIRVVAMPEEDKAMIRDKEKKEEPELKMTAQYYIENLSVALGKADFKLSDKRERLSGKIPNKQYAEGEFPFIEEKHLDRDIQEVYGLCFGVPGVCLQGKQIKAMEGEPGYSTGEGNLLQYRFRFASRITRVDRVQVKMTGEIPDPDKPGETMKVDGWVTVYQQEKLDDGSADDWEGPYPRWKPGIARGSGPPCKYTMKVLGSVREMNTSENRELLDKGEITLHYEVAKQGGKHENGMNEVRMDGVFALPDYIFDGEEKPASATPRHILMDIMQKYSGEPMGSDRYDTEEIARELAPLDKYEIGIMFDKAVPVFEAIERLQSGSILGFQFHAHEKKYTARLDDPNRGMSFFGIDMRKISHLEILNLHEVEVDWNAGLYGSHTDIEYAYNYSEGHGRRFIDHDSQKKILDTRRMEKEWKARTLLASKEHAKVKSKILLDDFELPRPLIKNIKLAGEKWHNMRVYDILEIDFRIPGEEVEKYPHHIIRLISEADEEKVVGLGDTDEYIAMINDKKETLGKRDFAGSLRCKVMRVELDTQTGITTIDVRQCSASGNWLYTRLYGRLPS